MNKKLKGMSFLDFIIGLAISATGVGFAILILGYTGYGIVRDFMRLGLYGELITIAIIFGSYFVSYRIMRKHHVMYFVLAVLDFIATGLLVAHFGEGKHGIVNGIGLLLLPIACIVYRRLIRRFGFEDDD